MKIFADYHHGGAARGQVLLLQSRLGHEVWFPGIPFLPDLESIVGPSIVSSPNIDWLVGLGGVPSELNKDWTKYINSLDEFLSTEWDAVLITRIETQPLFKRLLSIHPSGHKIKRIAMTGNDGCVFDWDFIPNLMSTDEPTYVMAPKNINKVWYSQELGLQFQQAGYVPIDERSVYGVNCFINCLVHFNQPWTWNAEYGTHGGSCPHCGSRDNVEVLKPPVNIYGMWSECKSKLPAHEFRDYGIICSNGFVPEPQLPDVYRQAALTWHMKSYDGFGFSMLQSIAMGRPVIVPRRFHRYRTANKYLIPGVTCFEAEWNSDSIVEIISYVSGSVGRANHYGLECWKVGKVLFDGAHDAFRVSEFLENLI